jgi:integrase
MASIVKRNNSYRVTVSNGYDINGKKIVRTKTFNKPDDMTDKKWEKEIQILALEFEREVENGLNINSNSTLKEYIEKWFKEYADKQLQPTTLESYHYWLDVIILPALGQIKLNKLTPMKILSLLNNLTEDGIRKDGKPGGYSNRIIKYQWQILSSALQQAVYWQILPENPCKRVKVPKNINKDNERSTDVKVKYYNENQTMLLLDIIKTEPIKYQIAVNIVIFCGLRVGELLGLTWSDIDFENKTLTINKSRSHTKEKGMFTKYPKNKSSIRTINIPDILIKLLLEYKVNQNSEKVICGDLWSEEWNKTPWLMTQWNGEGMYKNF